MATQDKPDDKDLDNELDDDVETKPKGSEDEIDDDADKDDSKKGAEDEDDDSDDDDSDDDDSSDDEDEDDDDFKKAFSQIKGDTPEEYLPNLEEAYRKSSSEGKRLSTEMKEVTDRNQAIMAAIASDPELAEKLDKVLKNTSGDKAILPTEDPALAYARTEMRKTMETEYQAFVDEHPEAETDPELQQELLEAMQDYKEVQQKRGRLPGMGEALRKAWVIIGKDDTKERVRVKAKETASKTKTNSNKKSSKKPEFTEAQLAVAKKLGLTEKQLAESVKATEATDY